LDAPSQEEKPETEDTIDSLGSLSISNDGRSTFFGQTANSWYLLQNEEGSEEEDEPPPNVFESPGTTDMAWLSHSFPFAAPIGESIETVRQSIMGKLPAVPVAKALCGIYYRHAAWM